MAYASYGSTSNNAQGLLGLQRTLAEASNPRRPVIGSWMQLPGASLARMIAQMGYDFIVVDCEHGNIADSEMHAVVGAIAAEGVSPLVRIPSAVDWLVKRAQRSARHPMPNDVHPRGGAQTRPVRKVSRARGPAYPRDYLRDTRGRLPIRPRRIPSRDGRIHRDSQPKHIDRRADRVRRGAGELRGDCEGGRDWCVTKPFYSAQSIPYSSVAPEDMLFVGPNDLCSSMGFPALEHANIPEVQEAIKRILAAAKAAGKYAGMFCVNAEQARARYEQGFDFVNIGADIVAIGMWNALELAKIKDLRP